MVKVSAVITTHKREPHIVERALKSVLQQTYKNMEIFVVDDSPSDYAFRPEVERMVKSYSNQGVTYIAHEICSGACAARNTGLYVANGEYIGFLDDDDEWMPQKVSEMLKGFSDEKIALVYCDTVTCVDGKAENLRKHKAVTGYIFDELILYNFIGSTSFPLLRTAALKEIGGFDIEMPAAQDYDVWLRIAKKYKVNFIPIPLARYYIHSGDQITKNSKIKMLALTILHKKHRMYLETHKKARAFSMLQFVSCYIYVDQRAKAIKTWCKAFFMYPLIGTFGIEALKIIIFSFLHRN